MRFLRPSLLFAATALIAAPLAARAQSLEPAVPPSITVVGTGEVSAAPDMAIATLTVLRSAETAGAALSASNTSVADVAAALRELGIEARDLQTGSFSISPQFRYDNDANGGGKPPVITGYEVRNTLTARVRDLSRLGEVLDRAVALGVNEGGNIAWQTEDAAAGENAARRQAVANARASAEVLAAAAAVSLGRVLSISDENGPSEPLSLAGEMRFSAAQAKSGVPVEAGELVTRSSVRMVFALEPSKGPR